MCDGTTTTRVADIYPGSADSSPSNLVAIGSTLFFRAYDPTAGWELWKSDGTTTSRVADIFPGDGSASPWGMTNAGGTLFFAATTLLEGTELWAYHVAS